MVEVDIDRPDTVNVASNDLTPLFAVTTFNHVAGQWQLNVDGPIALPENDSIGYFARSSNTDTFYLSMTISSNQITFMSHVLGRARNFALAKKAAATFEGELDKQGIKYHTTRRKDFIFH